MARLRYPGSGCVCFLQDGSWGQRVRRSVPAQPRGILRPVDVPVFLLRREHCRSVCLGHRQVEQSKYQVAIHGPLNYRAKGPKCQQQDDPSPNGDNRDLRSVLHPFCPPANH